MAELIITHQRKLNRLVEEAQVITQDILDKIDTKMLLEPEQLAENTMAAIVIALKNITKEAFVEGKQVAFNTIAAIPPVSEPEKASSDLTPEEIELLGQGEYLNWLKEFSANNLRFSNELTVWLTGQQNVGRAPVLILEQLNNDWNSRNADGQTNGRFTGWWPRAILQQAKQLVFISSRAGTQAVYEENGPGRDVA